MSDPFADRLAELAPTIDVASAREAFARRRRRAHRRRRISLAVVAIGVVGAGIGVIAWATTTTPDTITSRAPASTSRGSTSERTSEPSSSGPLMTAAAGHAGPVIVGEPTNTMPSAIVAGVVVLDDGCVRLQTDSDGRPLIVWPAGTRWDERNSHVVLPDGRRVAMGSTVDGGGGFFDESQFAQVMPSLDAAIRACPPRGIVLIAPTTITPPASTTPIDPDAPQTAPSLPAIEGAFDGSTAPGSSTEPPTMRSGGPVAARPDSSRLAGVDTLLGAWTDGLNTFEFLPTGVMRLTYRSSCEGSYHLDAGLLTVDFRACTGDAVRLPAPIFRGATVYVVPSGESIYLEGDAGVFRLDRVLTNG